MLPADMRDDVKTALEDYEQCMGLDSGSPNKNLSTSKRKKRTSVSATPMPMPKSTNACVSIESRKRAECERVSRPSAEASISKQSINGTTRKHKTILDMEDEIRSIRASWQQETYDLAQQQAKSAQTIAELRAQLKHRDMAEKACQGAGRNPLEETLYQYTHQNWTLVQKVKAMRKQSAFCQQTPVQSEVSIQQYMNETMSVVESELENILNGHESYPLLQLPSSDQHNSDLSCLVRSMFGSCGNEINLFNRSLVKFGPEPEVIVRALASAAMREWVFMSMFPDFGAVHCPLLNSYKKVVLSHDGWNSARNLEVAAYQSLMEEPHFENVEVPRKASEFAARFSRALAPLFRASDNHQPTSWGQCPEVAESRKFRLMGMFSAALNLKARSVMTDNSFEYVVYPPGKLQVVERYASTGNKGVTTSHASLDKAPDMMLYGSMNMYRIAPWVELESTGDSAMNTRNFIARDARDRTSDCLHNIQIQVSRNESQIYRDDGESQIGSAGRERSTPTSIQASVSRRKRPRVQTTVEIVDLPRNLNVLRGTDSKIQSNVAGKTCEICLKVLGSALSMARHDKNETCGCCSECGAIFSTRPEFSRHCIEQHQGVLHISFETARTVNRKQLSFLYASREPQDDVTDSAGPEIQSTPEAAGGGDESNKYHLKQYSHQSNHFESSHSSPQTKDKARLDAPRSGKELSCEKCGRHFIYPGSLEKHRRKEQCKQCPVSGISVSERENAIGLGDNLSRHELDFSGDEIGVTFGQKIFRQTMTTPSRSLLAESEKDNDDYNIDDPDRQVDEFDPQPPKKKRKASYSPVMHPTTSSV